jgi:hypothetical protein
MHDSANTWRLRGWALGTQAASQQESRQVETHNQQTEEWPHQVAAEDFVSLRPALETLASDPLSEPELQGLIVMREEEKLARDVYLTLYDTWGLQRFSNSAQNEQTHTEAIRDLLIKYNVTDPVINDNIGVFTDNSLQNLYTELVAIDTVSVSDALAVGVTIEELVIRDIQTDNDDITLVHNNLLRGSDNHMHAFMSQLISRGGIYEPQYITQASFDQIAQSGAERGSRGNRG